MIPEVFALIADALKHPTTGVNARLVAQRVDTSITEPVPAVVAIHTTLDAEDTVVGAPCPKLIISDEGAVEFAGDIESQTRESTYFPIGIRVQYENDDAAAAKVHALHTCRAIFRVLRNLSAGDESARVRNGVGLHAIPTIRYAAIAEEGVGRGAFHALLIADLVVRDLTP
jgi:hypothetical protein